MLNQIQIFVAWGLIVAWAGLGTARTVYVSPVGTNDYAGFYPDWAGAATNIQWGVNAATNGDVVLVTNFSYVLTTNIVVTNGITLRSWNNGNLDSTNTIVSGQGVARCLYISNNQALVAGFTITNGNGWGNAGTNYGGGVYEARGTLSNCVVAGNTANVNGGGIYMSGANALVTDCTIINNVITNTGAGSYYGGGGVYCNQGLVRNCAISSNAVLISGSFSGGGGVYVDYGTVTGCWIIANTASNSGGGIAVSVYAQVRNCHIYNNRTCRTAGGAEGGGGIYMSHYCVSTTLVADCVISGNVSALYGGGLHLWITSYSGKGGRMTNCLVYNNTALGNAGGGIMLYCNGTYSNDFQVRNCRIVGNSAYNSSWGMGGGARMENLGLMEDCIVSNNTAGARGGGLCLWTYNAMSTNFTVPVARNCLVVGNVASNWGGGIYIANTGAVENCTMANNRAVTAGGGLYYYGGGGTVSNSICYFNTAPVGADAGVAGGADWHVFSYNCIASTNALTNNVAMTGNITADPQFVATNVGNYRLTSASPCVNAGCNQSWMNSATDLDGNRRIQERVVDMGAYEFIRSGTIMIFR